MDRRLSAKVCFEELEKCGLLLEKLRAYDENGEEYEIRDPEEIAIAFQHE
jgi:hypothetical protein